MQKQLRNGRAAIFASYAGTVIGERLEVGAGKAYATLAAAMAYIAGKSWASSPALSGTVTSTASSASITGNGLSAVSPNDYLLVGGTYWAVKSIESNTAATLWHGAQSSASAQPATIKKLSQFTIVLYENQTIATATFPEGVSVLIVGISSNIRLIASGTLIIATTFKLEITHLTTDSVTSFILFGSIGAGRGIISIHDITNIGYPSGGSLAFVACASLTIKNIVGASYRVSVQTDYLLVDNVQNNSQDVNDVFLASQVLGTDNGHPFTFNNVRSFVYANATSGQDTGCEINGIPATKVINFTGCWFVSYASNIQAYPMWQSNSGGNYTYTNCIIDAFNSTFDLYDRRAGVGSATYNNTTRLAGGALRITTTLS